MGDLIAAIVLIGRYLLPRGAPSVLADIDEPDYFCPWCKEAMPDTPLIEEQEDEDDYATYAEENCSKCGNVVKFNDYTDEYDRFKARVDKQTTEA